MGAEERRGKGFVRGTVTTAALLLAGVSIAAAASIGPQAGMTGVPAIGAEAAEGLCVSCHTSFALNPDAAGTIALIGVPERYEAGRSYTLTIRVGHSDPAAMRWGFQLTAVATKDGSGAGELVATNTTTTQVLPSMSGTRTYMSHSYEGTGIGQAGGMSWAFEWKAPPPSTGPVGFFAAVNAANADGSNQGDRVYSRSPAPLAESLPSAP